MQRHTAPPGNGNAYRCALTLLALALVLPSRVSLGAQVTRREFTYRATLRSVAFAEEAETITNPLQWPQLKYVIPDGTFVEKGTVITRFDRDGLENELANLAHERAIVRAELAHTLTGIRNRDMALHDELEALRDRLSVLETQLERYRTLPEPDDVAIARGHLHVATLDYDAAREEHERAKGRYERGMISRAELDEYESTFREKGARHAFREGMLTLAMRPAESNVIRRMEMLIDNTNVETAKLEHEISRNKEISEIETKGAKARVDIIERRIAEKEADLESAVVHAPISGHVVYLPMFRQNLGQTGHKMWKNFAYMRMPNTASVAFKGALLEAERRFFKVGDPVIISVTGQPARPLQGEIVSISALSHDQGEQEEERSRNKADSGIMVYDTVIKPKETPAWLRIGLSATCELVSSTPLTAPSVPATFVKIRHGQSYLSIDGVYRRAEGSLIDGHFVLTDDALLGQTVDAFGRFPEEADRSASERSGRFRASGELSPSDTREVVVGDVYHWQKVAWLIPEDTMVEEGEVVVRLDTVDTEEIIKQTESEMESAVSQREKAEEELKLRTQENLFNLKRSRNLRETARLDLADLLDKRETESHLTARLNLELAAIRIEYLQRQLQRIEGKRAAAFSPMEIAQLRRDKERALLRKEAAEIRLQRILDGPEPAEIAESEFIQLDRTLDVVDMERKLETDRSRKNYELRRAERNERRKRDELEERWLEYRNLVLRAPRAGLARYGKVRNTGIWSKVSVGSVVSDRAVLMRIADLTQMHIRLDIPERYFTLVREGMRVQIKMRAGDHPPLGGTVSDIEFLFKRRRRHDAKRGLYSSHEALGETVFYIVIEVDRQPAVSLKPGAVADVVFPFDAGSNATEPETPAAEDDA